MIIEHLLAITIAFVLDRIVGDPPSWPHPVKWIGALIYRLDKRYNKGPNRKWKGLMMLFIVLLVVFVPALFISTVAYQIHPLVGIIVESILISTTMAQKSLKEAALEVYHPLQRNDFDEARVKLSYIVGRDTEKLDESEIVRGTVETVAENTSDGVTAPMFWAWVGGAPFALLYRAINTCDSMVGYKNDKYLDFGWASARMDDVVNWIPSRLTGFIMLLANRPKKTETRTAWRILYRDAKKHPSPNSGWCEAAAAALLGVQLGGINTYKGIVSNRALMGDPLDPLERNDIVKMNTILLQTTFFFLLILWLGGVFVDMAITWF
ncbi:cobalamin biosynthesis protein [Bacillus sp. V3B]|uniref:adenosylcobinamide-phosphate synthase CbiB n=1 Tax=Bacillus sp. V3B TaxID=2804915 RepID=UPI0021096B8E|nr:adenosylcobinamide-phosphate synthase CbiB [Bacillus sp. V3B]MCQ6276938.1 cobalamin biosynthesis protein [Bacillus sp. V3B]